VTLSLSRTESGQPALPADPHRSGDTFRIVVVPNEKYPPARKAEFLLSNATNAADYRKARTEVQKLGIDPDSIPHRRPA
jgi:hypothetical protein